MCVTVKTSCIFFIAYILLIIILTFSKYLFKKQDIFIILEAAVTIFISANFTPCVSLFLTVESLEYFLFVKNNQLTASIFSLLLPIIISNGKLTTEQYVIIAMIICSTILYYRMEEKKASYEKLVLDKNKKIDYLNSKLQEEKNLQNQTLYTAILEERSKISGNLHDKIGHTISAVLLQLEAIKFIIKADPDKASDMMDTSIETLRGGMNEIRVTLKSIRPAEEELGINRLKALMKEKTTNTKFKYNINYTGDLNKITMPVWHIITDSVMELSTNSMKYSKGDKINISLNVFNKIIKLQVSDNGNGCSKIVKNIGLTNIEDKISNFNGQVIFNGDNGFSTLILIPC